MDAYEARRNDPELREKVSKLLSAQNATLLVAAQALKDLAATMESLSIDQNPIYDRCSRAVWSAAYTVDRDAVFMNRGKISDTYIGNMAAGEMGEYLQTINFVERFQSL